MTATAPAELGPGEHRTGRFAGRRLETTAIVYLAWLATLVIGGLVVANDGGNLFSQSNLVKMLTGMSLLGFVAIGQTLVIVGRSLDLSVGYVVAWTSLIVATEMQGQGSRMAVAIVLALGAAALVGLVNGLVIVGLKVNPFIATLGTGLIIKGYLDTTYPGPAGKVTAAFRDFGYTRFGVVPLSTVVMIALAVAATFLIRRTTLGYKLFAIGGNDEVARFSGIRTSRTIVVAHVLCSVAAGVAGLLLAARFGTGDPRIYATGLDLDSIAAVVLGGTLLMGGRGSIAGTVAGVGILAVLDTTFDALQVNAFFKDVLRGTVIIVAVALYARRQIDRRSVRERFTRTGEAR